jgi:hypothetical protein
VRALVQEVPALFERPAGLHSSAHFRARGCGGVVCVYGSHVSPHVAVSQYVIQQRDELAAEEALTRLIDSEKVVC